MIPTLVVGQFQCPVCPALNYIIVGIVIGVWLAATVYTVIAHHRTMKREEQDDKQEEDE